MFSVVINQRRNEERTLRETSSASNLLIALWSALFVLEKFKPLVTQEDPTISTVDLLVASRPFESQSFWLFWMLCEPPSSHDALRARYVRLCNKGGHMQLRAILPPIRVWRSFQIDYSLALEKLARTTYFFCWNPVSLPFVYTLSVFHTKNS